MEIMKKSELLRNLKELTKRAKEASEGYIYLRNDGEIIFSRNSNIEHRGKYQIVAGHYTPLKKIDTHWADMVANDYFDDLLLNGEVTQEKFDYLTQN